MTRRVRLISSLLAAASALLALCFVPVHLPSGDDFRTPSSAEADRKERLDFGRVLRQELPAKGSRIEAVEVQIAGGSTAAALRIQVAVKKEQTWKTLRDRIVRVKARRAHQAILVHFSRPAMVKLGDRLAVLLSTSEARDVPLYAWVNTEFLRPELALLASDTPIAGTLQLTVRYEPQRGPLAVLLPRLMRRLTVLMRPRERVVFALAWLVVGIGIAWLVRETWQDERRSISDRPP